jgi:hypothetical protein
MTGTAAAATGAVLMRNRPVYGASCVVPSAFLSTQVATQSGIATSHQPGASACGTGRSPSYWQQGYDSNSYGLLFLQPLNHFNNAYPSDLKTFASLFGAGPAHPMGYVLWSMAGSAEYQFAAGYLNALNNNRSAGASISSFPLTTAQVIQMYNGTYTDGTGTRWTVTQGENYLISIAV